MEVKADEQIMPVLFIGHGSPTFTLDDNEYIPSWKKIAQEIPKPKCVLCISAHWLTDNVTKVTAMEHPKTIHDFGMFSDELYEIQYNAPGSPEIANDIKETLKQENIELDYKWGMDHGSWCVLRHMYPNEDVPVLQLSIDYSKKDLNFHFELGKKLSYLRQKGVLIIGSGNIVHNLRVVHFQKYNFGYEWAKNFDAMCRKEIKSENFDKLINYKQLGSDAILSVPTPDHYIPLLYILGLKHKDDKVHFPVSGFNYGSLSMTSIIFSR